MVKWDFFNFKLTKVNFIQIGRIIRAKEISIPIIVSALKCTNINKQNVITDHNFTLITI